MPPDTGLGREQFRLFCLLEIADDAELMRRGLAKPAIAVITGVRRPWRASSQSATYREVRQLGDAHKTDYPRRIAM
jgi:hypothetical protein